MTIDAALPSTQGPARAGAPIILVVEDDLASREALAAFVVSSGYSVLQAGDGREAMRLIEIRRDIAMVLTDVVMPGVNGIDLLQRVRTAHPGVKIALITGDPASIDAVIASQAIAVLKPYDFNILERVIADALDAPPGG
jgi:DNA-binding NtrC family response regulator